MFILDYIKKTIRITNIILFTAYCILKYKLHLTTYTDSVITVCDSLVKHSYIFIKIIQWGIQDMYDDFHISNNEKLIQYFNTFSNNVPYTPLEFKESVSCINNAIKYAITRNDELIIENNYIPMNSGSVALIFKARLNKKDVIIKVLRHNIINIINNDVCLLLHLFDNIIIKKIINYYLKLNSKLSAIVLVDIIKIIMSIENVELNHDICNLFLIAMSGLQTIEAGVKHDDHDKSSLTYVLESYIKKIKI